MTATDVPLVGHAPHGDAIVDAVYPSSHSALQPATKSISNRISEKKEEDGKTSLIVTRTFVQTGKRIEGRAEILKGLKDGDRVVAVGQLKLQSGSAVTISSDPTPPIPAKPPRY